MLLKSALQTVIFLSGFALLFSACQSASENQDASEQAETSSVESQTEQPLLLFVGTYTEGDASAENKSEGIYIYEMNPSTGELKHQSTASGIMNPSYLAIHPSKQYIYAVSETGGNDSIDAGLVYAYRFDQNTKQLHQINAVSSHGKYPCYVSVHPSGNFVAVANYGGGNVALYPLSKEGALQKASSVVQHEGKGPTSRQETPHAHMITPGQQKDYLYAVDLGIDKVMLYEVDTEAGKLIKTDKNTQVASAAGPRHLTFHPTQNWAYLVNEINGTIAAHKVDPANGALTHFQTISTLPQGSSEGACADIHVTPSGKYLYASNRGQHNNIAMYTINQESGELTLLGHQSTKGETPRNFVIDPSGTFLLVANQNTDNVITFKIDHATGKLIDTGIETKIPKPVCLKFM